MDEFPAVAGYTEDILSGLRLIGICGDVGTNEGESEEPEAVDGSDRLRFQDYLFGLCQQ